MLINNPPSKWQKGSDYLAEKDDYWSYGISYENHENMIIVYGDEDLRNKILEFLRDTEY